MILFFLVTSFPFIDNHKCGCKFIEQIIQNKIFLLFFMFVLQINTIQYKLVNTNYYRHAKISSFKSFREFLLFHFVNKKDNKKQDHLKDLLIWNKSRFQRKFQIRFQFLFFGRSFPFLESLGCMRKFVLVKNWKKEDRA